MGVIGNQIGEVRYVDLPVTAGTNPTVSWNTDRVLDLIGVDVLAEGATAAALKVNATAVPAGDISSFANNRGSVYAAAPAGGVPTAAAGGGAQQDNSTTAGNVNWQTSGTVQPVAVTLTTALTDGTATTALAVTALPVALADGAFVTVGTDVFTLSAAEAKGATALAVTSKAPTASWGVGTKVTLAASGIVDRNGSVPEPAALVPLDAAIPTATAVEVDLTGTVVALAGLPAANGEGLIEMPVGNAQEGFTDEPYDNIPFQVKATDTELDTFAGVVRLVFQVPVSDPNSAGKAAGTYPDNGVQKGSGY